VGLAFTSAIASSALAALIVVMIDQVTTGIKAVADTVEIERAKKIEVLEKQVSQSFLRRKRRRDAVQAVQRKARASHWRVSLERQIRIRRRGFFSSAFDASEVDRQPDHQAYSGISHGQLLLLRPELRLQHIRITRQHERLDLEQAVQPTAPALPFGLPC